MREYKDLVDVGGRGREGWGVGVGATVGLTPQ